MVGTWNIQRLGHGSTRDPAEVVAVLERFDLVAIQEVMTREAIDDLVARMPGWSALLTDTALPVGGSGHREFYAFLYREARLEAALNTTVPDREDAFVREPFLGCFIARLEGETLCLLTIHVTYGRTVEPRKREVLALDDALAWARASRRAEENWIVLGDFNRVIDDGDADDEPEAEWAELLGTRGLVPPMHAVGDEVPTTLGKRDWANEYDHILVSEGLEARVVEAGRIDIVADHCAGDFERCRGRLSDHAPLFVRLRLHE